MTPTKLKFRPYGTNKQLPIVGRAKVQLRAEAGAVIETYVYVNDDAAESSLLGEKDAQRLGIVTMVLLKKSRSGVSSTAPRKSSARPRKHRDTARRRWRGICRG